MRSAKEQEFFPYNSKTTCYILVHQDGKLEQVQHTKANLAAAVGMSNMRRITKR